MNHNILNFRKLAVLLSSILVCFVVQGFSADLIGYAWPKSDLLITNTTPSRFKGLKNGGTYPLIVKLDSGYSIVYEGADGQTVAALLPLKDRFGNPLTVNVDDGKVTVSSRFVIMDSLDEYVRLSPGVVPIQLGKKYVVLDKSGGNLSLQFTYAELTQTVSVAEVGTRFLTLTEYAKAADAVIQDLKSKADTAITNGDFEAVSDIFKLYQGEFADDTVDPRAKLVNEYAKRVEEAESAKRWQQRIEAKKFAAEQMAKGLVEFHGEWVTPADRDTRMAKEAEEARQQAEHDQWVEDHKSEITQEIVATNVKANDKAVAAYPDDYQKQEVYWEQLARGYDAEICRKYGISQTKLDAILTEWGKDNKRAFDRKWQQFQNDMKESGQ